MLKKMFMGLGAGTARKEQEAFLRLVQVGTDSEMANGLASAAIARWVLDSSEDLAPSPFPEAIFRGHRPLDNAAKAELATYNMYLGLRRKSVSSNPDPRHQYLAAGISVYLFSFRALVRPELFPTGRLIWSELMRGAKGYLETMAGLSPNLTQEEASALFPAPNILAPNEV